MHDHDSCAAVRRDGQLRSPRKKDSALGTGFWIDIGIVARAILYALAAHLLEIALWAVVLIICGEFPDFGTAYYHSAVNTRP